MVPRKELRVSDYLPEVSNWKDAMTDALRERLIQHEGIRLRLYADTRGKLTIGVGHNIQDRGLTYAQVVQILNDDVVIAETELDKAFPWAKTLDQTRRDVFIELSFNMGLPVLLEFTNMLAAANRKDWPSAADALLQSAWAAQVGARAVTLSNLLRA